LKRASRFPQARVDAEDIYVFDATTWDVDDLKEAEEATSELVALLGIEDDDEVVEKIWIHAEADSPLLGKEVPFTVLQALGHDFLAIDDKAVAKLDGRSCLLRQITLTDLTDVVRALRPPAPVATDDVRIAFAVDPTVDHVSEDVGKIIRGLIQHPTNKHWGYLPDRDGPPAIKDYCGGAIEAAQTLINFPIVWRKDVGIEDSSRIRHEQDHAHEVLQTALVRDGLNIFNCLCFEKIIRRCRYTQKDRTQERASSSRAKNYLGGVRDAHGGVRTPAFDEWVFQREKADAKARAIDVQNTANALKEQELEKEKKKRKGDGKGGKPLKDDG
jgi:hypothetical protein